jgi:probable phosphoglycerate mutase
MTRVVLIRPGSTDYDEQQRIQGTLDVPLNAHGSHQASVTAGELRDLAIAVVYSGNEQSARDTARAIGKATGIRVRELHKLHNLNHGLWQGLQEQVVRRKHPKVYRQWCEEPTTVCPPGGETFGEAFDRVRRVVRPLLKRHRDAVFAIVAPEPIGSVIRCYLEQQDLARIWDLRNGDGRWQVVDVAAEQSNGKVER